jgi:hypothetical protein
MLLLLSLTLMTLLLQYKVYQVGTIKQVGGEWLEGWLYRKSITVSNPHDFSLSNYTVKLL